jgi:hypothetical protein
MTSDVSYTYVKTKLEAQGFTLSGAVGPRYRLKKSGSKASCGALAIPSLDDIPEEVAVDILDSIVLDAINAAVKDPAYHAK